MPEEITPQLLRSMLGEYVHQHRNQRTITDWWRTPILATARTDERFHILSDIAAPDHMPPQSLLPKAQTLIVFFLSFKTSLGQENAPGKFPCRNWGLAYEATNHLIGLVSEHIAGYLHQKGYKTALTPATHNFDPKRLVARWSHKHLAHIAGLGRFGFNAQMITPSGCAGRLGSLVTDAVIEDSPLVTDEELCLFKKGEECLQCVSRCPVKAVTEKGIDRQRCWDRLKFNLKHVKSLSGLGASTHVCGKCAVDLPCSGG